VISPARLAWFQLRRQRGRLAVAAVGVAFAGILMLMQLGFMDALFDSAVALHRRLDADLVLIHPHYKVVSVPTQIPRERLYQALALDDVAEVAPVYTAVVRFRNPWNGSARELLLLGIDPSRRALAIPRVEAQRSRLGRLDVGLFDSLSRPEFGPVAESVSARGALDTEVDGRRVSVHGLFELGTTIGIDATLITGDTTFGQIVRDQSPREIGLGLVRLRPGASAARVQAALAGALPDDVEVLTRDQLVRREIHFWQTHSPIGFVFTFGVAMGVVVGMIIVYQVLFADIADHLPEYATLKVLGYTDGYLVRVVMAEATVLAIVGFPAALAVAGWLYGVAAEATRLPLALAPSRLVAVFALTLGMGWISALIAARKLRSADPVEMLG
jgi:putative ABC transport system permease protein